MNNPKDCIHCYDYEDMGCKMPVCEFDFPSIDTPKCNDCSKFIKKDLVQVVRCKDCIHKPRGTRNKHDMEFPDEICPCQCEDDWYSWMPYDDWFCADGKRREDETD